MTALVIVNSQSVCSGQILKLKVKVQPHSRPKGDYRPTLLLKTCAVICGGSCATKLQSPQRS